MAEAENSPEDSELMSEEYKKSLLSVNLSCDPCTDDNNQVFAAGFCVDCNDYLCHECYQAHKRAKPLRKHILKDVKSMPTSKPKQETKLEGCYEHKNEPIKWHCESHDQSICDVCKQIDHRNCMEVKTLNEISRDIFSSEQLKNTKNRLIHLQKEFRENLNGIKDNTDAVQKCYNHAIEEMTKCLSKIRDKDLEVMRALELTCDTSIATITTLLGELETLTERGEEKQGFFMTRKVQSQLQTFDARLKSVLEDNKIMKYEYVPDSSSNRQGVIGKLCEIQDVITPVKLEEINVKTPSDTDDCCITGIDKLSDHRLAVADRNNKKLKIVDMTSKTVISELKLDASPWDLTKVDDHKIAVTTYGNKKLLIVSVSNTLTVQKTIDTTYFSHCKGIVSNNDRLIVSYHRPDQIEVLDTDGTVKQVIENKHKDGTIRFGDVYYIAQSPDTNTLYLCDRTRNKVTSMTLDGRIISSFTHEQLKGPRGITVGRDSRIFVCSYSSHKIFEISADLSRGKIAFGENDGISSPYSIQYNDKNHKLIVGSENKNTLQVFLV